MKGHEGIKGHEGKGTWVKGCEGTQLKGPTQPLIEFGGNILHLGGSTNCLFGSTDVTPALC